MHKNRLLLSMLLCMSAPLFSQCLIAPAMPSCTGTETLVTDNDQLNVSQVKYYYGSAGTKDNVKMSGGTLVVCNDLTINNLTFDSGTIYIHPSVTLVVNNPAGLILNGNTAIYNKGVFRCMGNLVMNNLYTSATRQNIFINITSASILQMPNTYFVINNPYSRFVNNGTLNTHGLITDYGSSAGCVCLGNNSTMNMTVLYNKVKNTYVVPDGMACLSVTNYSQFYDTLTQYPNLNVCLGPYHSSDASCVPWGCKPNAWGNAHVVLSCTNCMSTLTVLNLHFVTISASATKHTNEISWQMNANATDYVFYVQRSLNGTDFTTIDTVKGDAVQYHVQDDFPAVKSFYRVIYYQPASRQSQISKIVSVQKINTVNNAYPNPFKNEINIPLSYTLIPGKLTVTDITGEQVSGYTIHKNENNIRLLFHQLPSGFYFIKLQQGTLSAIYKVYKE